MFLERISFCGIQFLLLPIQNLYQGVDNLNQVKADKEFVALEVEDVSPIASCRTFLWQTKTVYHTQLAYCTCMDNRFWC